MSNTFINHRRSLFVYKYQYYYHTNIILEPQKGGAKDFFHNFTCSLIAGDVAISHCSADEVIQMIFPCATPQEAYSVTHLWKLEEEEKEVCSFLFLGFFTKLY